MTQDFSPTTYLSALHNRHQTLEDLRTELRTRSQELSKELLDLVNTNYQDFLGLGSSLRGGEEKIEEITVGLLGFKRDVEGVRRKVATREVELSGLIKERREVRKQVHLGRMLVEIDARLEELERRLMLDQYQKSALQSGLEGLDISDSEEESGDEDIPNFEEEGAPIIPIKKLRQRLQDYLVLQQMMAKVGLKHPFLISQESRTTRVQNTILLDLSTALKQSKKIGEAGRDRLMKILALYRDMEQAAGAVQAIKETESLQ